MPCHVFVWGNADKYFITIKILKFVGDGDNLPENVRSLAKAFSSHCLLRQKGVMFELVQQESGIKLLFVSHRLKVLTDTDFIHAYLDSL